jgi:hypothetical protein
LRPTYVGNQLLDLLRELEGIAEKGAEHDTLVNAAPSDFQYYKTTIELNEQHQRKKFAREIAEKIQGRYGASKPRVFVSFSLPRHATIAADVFNKEGFYVCTGFDETVQFGDDLTQNIIDVIVSCNYFIGIWAPSVTVFDVEKIDADGRRLVRQQGSGPSVWLPFELGVACARRMPFRLLVPMDIHENIKARTNPNQVSVQFANEAELKTQIQICASHWRDKWRQVAR